MSVQLTYELKQAIAYAGLLFAQHPHDIDSFAAEAEIAFAIAVSRGTDPDKEVLPGGAGTAIGISIRSLEREGAINTGDISYKVTETVGVLRAGYVWAVCPAGCVPGDDVKYNDTTGVLDSGAPAAGESALTNATWETTAAAGALGVIRIKK